MVEMIDVQHRSERLWKYSHRRCKLSGRLDSEKLWKTQNKNVDIDLIAEVLDSISVLSDRACGFSSEGGSC